MSNFLIHIDAAKREILAADSLLKIKDLWNKADAMRALGQAAKDPALINSATEFKLRCERRLGELLAVEIQHGGQNKRGTTPRNSLADLDLDKNLSSRAQRLAAVSEEKFEAALAEAKTEEQEITRRTVDKLLQPNEEKIILPSAEGKYRTIIIDPPWQMEKILREVRPRQHMMDYPSMTFDEILALPIGQLADPSGCHVYCWFTQAHRRQAEMFFDAWGVKAECFLTWIKNVGFTPFSWMYSTEHVLFGRVGNLKLLQMGIRLDFAAKVREHSRKPDEFYEIVRRASPEPRLEMFAREKREGFVSWGNEVGKFVSVG